MQCVVECVLDNAWVKVRRYSTCNGTVYYCMEGDTMNKQHWCSCSLQCGWSYVLIMGGAMEGA